MFVDDDDDVALGRTQGFDVSAEDNVPWLLPTDRYRIVGEIGRGGMGVVLLVVDTSFNRPLAIKVLRNALDRSEAAERRFIEEARITGQLQHPGIPPVHEVGRLSDGRPFFSMKLIEGRTLDVLLAKRPSPHANLPGFLKIFEQIAQTIAYAHSQCVIHRDLKPHNIMVGTFGEVQVMDWGLAKRMAHGKPVDPPADVPNPPSGDASGLVAAVRAGVEWSDSQTEAGEILGTFAYMSPEQARGERLAANERWDVFGLGAMLCTILTGKPPYVGDASPDLWRKAQNADLGPAWERLDACGADPELVALAKRCLAPKADDRPHDAGQVAAEIGLYLASLQERLEQTRLTQARAEVAAREERKRRRLAVVLAAAVVVLIASASAFGVWYTNERAQRKVRSEHLSGEVAAALDEAIRARDDLHARLRDPQKAAQLLSELHQWQSLAESAQASLRRAQTLSRSGRELLSPDLHARLATVAAQLNADEQDRQLAFALDRIRLEVSGLVNMEIQLDSAAPKLATTFRKAGYGVEDASPAELAARIRKSTIRLPLVAGLDFWALATKDQALQARLLEVARRADPHPWRDRFRQPNAWADKARLEALASEVDLDEQSPQVLATLAYRLSEDTDLVRRALIAHPRDLWLLFQLGMNSKNPVEQAGAFRAALAVRPEAAVIYYNLGVVQQFQKQPVEAAAYYRKAVELEPNYGVAYNNLGLVLDQLGQTEEALRCYRLATERAPQSVKGHINLGGALHALERFDEAIASYRKASELEPNNPALLNNLGSALRAKGQLDEAANCYRKSLEIDASNPWALCNLGHVLNIQGKFEEALDVMRRGHEIGSRQPDWTHPSAVWIKDTEARVALEKKLAAVLRREATPSSAEEYAGMAELCVQFKKRYAAAYRFYAAAFAAAPKIAEDLGTSHRFNAACAGVLTADGQGEDAAELDGDARVAARRQALAWLRADLKANTELLDRNPKENQTALAFAERARTDPDFASVRETAGLSKLSPGERGEWQQLWGEIAALLRRAGDRKP